jgi:hypothetical protein
MGKFVIIKKITSLQGVEVPVILLDGIGEVLEFETQQEAQDLKDLFQKNSDSGHTYEVKKI